MDRYLLFHGEYFYPSGGMIDFKESSNELNDLISFISKLESCEWAHIYDSHEKKIIFESEDISTNYIEIKYEWKKYERN